MRFHWPWYKRQLHTNVSRYDVTRLRNISLQQLSVLTDICRSCSPGSVMLGVIYSTWTTMAQLLNEQGVALPTSILLLIAMMKMAQLPQPPTSCALKSASHWAQTSTRPSRLCHNWTPTAQFP